MTWPIWQFLIISTLENFVIIADYDIYDNYFDNYCQVQQFSQQKDNKSIKDNNEDNLGTCDIWDTDYNSDNQETEFMTIFDTWQLRVTLTSIGNSCDGLFFKCFSLSVVQVPAPRVPGGLARELTASTPFF